MKTQTSSPLQFRNMISEFCDKRVMPHVSEEILDMIKSYLDDLIVQHRKPPMRRSQIDWLSFASESRVDCELTGKLKSIIRPALEALIRWVDNSVPQSDQTAPKHKIRDRRPAVRLPKQDRAPASGRTPVRPKSPSLAPADPVEEFPEPLFAWTEDPQTFQQALNYHMRRFGETYWRLHRAIIKQHEIFDIRTISNWANGTKTPRSADSFDVLTRIEKRYRLPESYDQVICVVGALLFLPRLRKENASGRTCRLALTAGFQDRGELGFVEKIKPIPARMNGSVSRSSSGINVGQHMASCRMRVGGSSVIGGPWSATQTVTAKIAVEKAYQ